MGRTLYEEGIDNDTPIVELLETKEKLSQDRKDLIRAKELAQELVKLVGHCEDPKCEGKWCKTAREFIELMGER